MVTEWQRACATLAMARTDALEEVESDAEIVLLGGAQSDAAWTLLTAPAPDAEALALKLEVFRDEEAYRLNGVSELISVMIADARRLRFPPRRGPT